MEESEISEILLSGTRQIYNLSHQTDFDGIASAAIIMHYTGMPKNNLHFGIYTAESFGAVKDWSDRIMFRDSIFVITDMSVNDILVPDVERLLSSVKARNNMIFWIDHHPWGAEAIDKISKYADFLICGENNVCAAELAYSILSKRSESARAIAETAHKTDFNLRTEENKGLLDMLSCAITYMCYTNDIESLKEMVRDVSNLKLDSSLIKEKYGLYNADVEKNLSVLYGNMKKFVAGKHTIGISYSKNLQSTQGCMALKEKLDTEINIMINTDTKKINLRSADGVDCSFIAKAFGGGGHPQASGAEVPAGIDLSKKEGIEKLNQMIIEVSEAHHKTL